MQDLIECACGCGGTLSPTDKRGRPRQFLPSHWSRVQTNTIETVPCEACGKPLQRSQYQRTRVKHQFCDQVCAGRWASQHGIRKGANNGHYNTITAPCAGCGAPVSKAKSLVERRNNRVYCKACVHLVRRGRPGFYVGYPPEFNDSLRTKIRRRDKYTCQHCGKHQRETGTLHIHHIDYTKHNNDPRNLISLCRVCHGLTNFGTEQWQAIFEGLMRERFPDRD